LQQSADGAGLALRLDTSRIRADLDDLTQLGERFGRTITSAFARGIVSGRKFSTILRSVMQRLTSQALTAAIRPLGNLISGSLGSLLGGITANAQGNLLSQGRVTPFAAGGIVNSPTMFAMRGGTGLMGEAGPEAIMPLARGRDGKLGVRVRWRSQSGDGQHDRRHARCRQFSALARPGHRCCSQGVVARSAPPLTAFQTEN
jgi:hypothetical protein